MKDIISIIVKEWDGENHDYCLVNLFTTSQQNSIDFTFNMEYLFEWVNDEHRSLFVKEICERMLFRERIKDYEWATTVDFTSIVLEMQKIWELRFNKKK